MDHGTRIVDHLKSGGKLRAHAIDPGTFIGAYEILGLLGAGGMGEVYHARDTRLRREVAIEVPPDALMTL